ncbi:uncharacterized protein LOC135844912 isoform X6 [Planococcus citri]|uniref:uncharacterized protein LOC135844912 isoform X6 n=1 Tax=Planococcus citri TaxID=170843 RepID=UPI0031F93A61
MSSLEPLCDFRRNPCTLEHIASVVSAAVLCRRAAMMNPTNPPEKVQEIIALPPAIEQKIQRFMPIVKVQIAWWNNFYDREIFFDTPDISRAEEYFHVLVWSDDGSINDEETARAMLKQDDLSTEKKYRIACNHCLETEIRKFWQILKTDKNLQKRDYLLVYYWECVSKSGHETNGLTKYIIKKLFNSEYFYPDCAVYYFLSRLISVRRIDYLPVCHQQIRSFRSWVNFLMKLSNEQLVELFNYSNSWQFVDNERDLFHYLMRFWMHADFVVQVWLRIRGEYSNSAFAGLIEEVFMCRNFPFRSTDYISLAEEIFNLAPYELRLAAHDDYLLCGWWNRNSYLTDVRFDVAILSTVDADDSLYVFWDATWLQLFQKYPADCFMQLLHVCLGGEIAEERFKTSVLKLHDYFSKEYCRFLFAEMRFSELDQFLNVFSSDICRIMRTKEMLLRRCLFDWPDYLYFFKSSRFIFPPPNQFVDFIEGSFESIRSANEFKIKILSSVHFLKACYKAAGNDMFDWLKDAVWMCSCNDDDFKLYKSKFLQLSVDELAKSSDLPDFLQEQVDWLKKSHEDFSDVVVWTLFPKLPDIPDISKDPGWTSFFEWCSNEN